MSVQRAKTYQNGAPLVDPTPNVMELVKAESKRQDDLREAEARRLNEIISIKSDYETKLALAESKRIDAIRAVDVNAVAIASAEARQQASVLANEVTKSAETLRSLVATTDAARAASLTAILQPLSDRVSLLEKSQYQISGRGTGMSLSLTLIVTAVSLVLAMVGIVSFFNAAT